MMRRALVLLLAFGCAAAPREAPSSGTATLGVTTSVPSEALARELGLSREVRVHGRRVDSVDPGGPAERAGLRAGDVLLRLGENDLYSADDIADFLSVSSPGDEVGVAWKRPVEGEKTGVVTLGAAPPEAGPRLAWEFASLGQFPRALAAARERNARVLVGVSGAET